MQVRLDLTALLGNLSHPVDALRDPGLALEAAGDVGPLLAEVAADQHTVGRGIASAMHSKL